MTDIDKKPSKLKMGIIIFVVFIIGVMVGSSGKSSTTRSTNLEQSKSSRSELVVTESPKPLGKVEVKSHGQRMDSGYTKVVGEVVNNTTDSVENVKIIATFYNKDGQVLGTGDAHVQPTWDVPFEAGNTLPFEVKSYPDKYTADHYKLDLSWD